MKATNTRTKTTPHLRTSWTMRPKDTSSGPSSSLAGRRWTVREKLSTLAKAKKISANWFGSGILLGEPGISIKVKMYVCLYVYLLTVISQLQKHDILYKSKK